MGWRKEQWNDQEREEEVPRLQRKQSRDQGIELNLMCCVGE